MNKKSARVAVTGADRALLRYGIALFLLGLLSGIIVPAMTNPRMGVSGHLEGVMNGTYLVVAGLIWGHLRLTNRARSTTRALLLFGTYANWVATELAAAFGTSSSTPIAGAGHTGKPWQEAFVNVLLYTLSVAIIAATGGMLWGLRGGSNSE